MKLRKLFNAIPRSSAKFSEIAARGTAPYGKPLSNSMCHFGHLRLAEVLAGDAIYQHDHERRAGSCSPLPAADSLPVYVIQESSLRSCNTKNPELGFFCILIREGTYGAAEG